MRRISFGLFALLSAIAALHVYWALGGLWPGTTEQELANAVMGEPGLHRIPPALNVLVVAALIFAAGWFALAASRVVYAGPAWFVRCALAVLTLVFIGRGVAGFALAARGAPLVEPFATLDLWLYAPLCLLIGGAFARLLYASFRPQ